MSYLIGPFLLPTITLYPGDILVVNDNLLVSSNWYICGNVTFIRQGNGAFGATKMYYFQKNQILVIHEMNWNTIHSGIV